MSGENKYVPGVETTKPRKSLVIILAILLCIATILALIFLATTLYFLLARDGPGNKQDASGTKDLSANGSGSNGSSWMSRVENVRLPYTVIPLHYDLRLQANIYGSNASNFNFTGSVRVRLQCREATDVFFVHANKDVNVNQKAVRNMAFEGVVPKPRRQDFPPYDVPSLLQGVLSHHLTKMYDQLLTVDLMTFIVVSEHGGGNLIKEIVYDKARQWFRITTVIKLQSPNTYYIFFDEFGGPLTINLRGWYLSSYVENNVTKYLVTSQLQPTEARRVFPCWDEPAFKSVFEITLVRKEGFRSMSNMPLAHSRHIGDGWVEDSFKPTLNTSTYLLAFVISQFKNLSDVDYKGRSFRVWARPDLLPSAYYALNLGKIIIGFFEKYFGLDYPLEKTDMLAVPHFAAGAMENWGLMIYREATLIWDPESGTELAKQKVATVIAHEIAHQWFGNLVTLDWWDDLWLNEGFATFSERIGVAHAEPSWKMDELFAVQQMQKVLFVDSLPTTHPVFLPVSHPDEINESFDAISYNKGAAVLRMMEAFISPTIFRHGLKIYLSKHKFKNTKPSDLWSALTEANKLSNRYIDVEAIMNVWIKQAGYPIVTVRRLGGNQFELTQERFLLDLQPNTSSTSITPANDTIWSIPITYAVESDNMSAAESRIIWMYKRNLNIPINVDENKWYAINLRQTGFYRVNYDMENWQLLIKALRANHQEIPRLMRAQIIDDSFHIANQGSLPFDVFLNLTRYLRSEREYVPLSVIHRVFIQLYDTLVMHDSQTLLKRYVKSLISDAYAEIDWNSVQERGTHLQNMARQIIVSMACGAGHRDCIDRSMSLFKAFMEDPVGHKQVLVDLETCFFVPVSDRPFLCRIPTSLSPTVFCTALREGGAKEWDFLKKMSMEVLHEDERYRISEALGCSRDFNRLKGYVRELIKDALSKFDDLELPGSLNGNPIGLYVVYDTLKREWLRRSNERNLIFAMLSRAIEKRGICIVALPIQEDLIRMNKTLTEEQDVTAGRYIHRILMQSSRNQKWLSKHAYTIHKWLKSEIASMEASSLSASSRTIQASSIPGDDVTAAAGAAA
ncbi:hypothetical protein Aperf_G00000062915 [Anoplocephala perfoliata]